MLISNNKSIKKSWESSSTSLGVKQDDLPFISISFDNIKTLMFASYDLNLNIYNIPSAQIPCTTEHFVSKGIFFSTTFLSADTGRPRFECSPTEKGKPGFG